MITVILKDLKAALENRVSWPVYYAFDSTPFAERADWFLTLDIHSTELQTPFLNNQYLFYPFLLQPQITLLAPKETDALVLQNNFCSSVLSGMFSSGCSIDCLQLDPLTIAKPLQKSAVSGIFSLYGIARMTKREEAGILS